MQNGNIAIKIYKKKYRSIEANFIIAINHYIVIFFLPRPYFVEILTGFKPQKRKQDGDAKLKIFQGSPTSDK